MTGPGSAPEPLLEISDLSVSFRADRRTHQVVSGVSMRVAPAQRVGIIGESGSGKTVTALSVLGLHDWRRTRYGARSSIRFLGRELLRMPPAELRQLRGASIAMVFQDPVTSLNPVFTVGSQLIPVLRVHQNLSRQDAHEAAVAALRAVEIRDPAGVLGAYPHELSGGMRQRVLIAMAIACQPRVLIADEPTSALDVTVQATVLDLVSDLVAGSRMSLLLITHDMGVVARLCSYVYVMYAGRVVEQGPVDELFRSARHPYTRALLQSTPRITGPKPRRLNAIASSGVPAPEALRVPGGTTPPSPPGAEAGCAFAPRCSFAVERCLRELPLLEPAEHAAACHRWPEVLAAGSGETSQVRSAPGPASE
jgi:peptide/nickel transport system ATP-binding protein